eukprot:CAMPEP_0114561022 /NCGR_PEP_ID=MMETSP0114-20121206/11780_1 /TAXON_ID=31324 /ORGANISM="Goniomonas sp, Strain m" /LENGTH=240 /DNA_ID=CAMNT_0001746625 /DNA_START=273 /DNA_END=992 /DNA_ORIENTATION=-
MNSKQWWLDALVGLLCGAIGQTVIFAILEGSGYLQFSLAVDNTSSVSTPVAFLLSILTYLMVSVFEETAFRGYFIQNIYEGVFSRRINRGLAFVLAIFGSSVSWGIYHAVLDNATVMSTCVVCCYGLLFGSAYVWSGHLGTTMGFHTAWNLFETNVFGFSNSGMDVGISAITVKIDGPSWLTGGDFGPEAGVSGATGMVTGYLLLFLYLVASHGRPRPAPSLCPPAPVPVPLLAAVSDYQ